MTLCYIIVIGKYSEWSSFTTCTVTCGTGQRNRIRTCYNPLPQNERSYCSGPLEEIEECNTQGCPSNI